MGSGYIFQIDQNNELVNEKAYFVKRICRVETKYLIEKGYLTPLTTQPGRGYDTSGLVIKNRKYTPESVSKVFEGKKKKTSEIIKTVLNLTLDREGVMFFAATVRHAQDVLSLLPSDDAALITGETKKKERESIIKNFKNKKIKYLVNVAVLTTGFDAPHVDAVAILRPTESAALFQQIIGRGLRLSEGKKDCLIMDFAENIERHELSNDIFTPKIQEAKQKKEAGGFITANCKLCNFDNNFKARPNTEKLKIDKDGDFIDLTGNKIMAAHYGRRCNNHLLIKGKFERCSGRWASKECEECGQENDIAARICEKCKHELVNPEDKLSLDFARIKASTTMPTIDYVLKWHPRAWTS